MKEQKRNSKESELQGHNLSLTAKEKLSEDDVEAYKHWLIDRSLEDSFEIRVLIMEEAREETSGFGERRFDGPLPREKNGFRGRTFTTRSKPRSCVVDTCKQNHLPWVCKAFKELPIRKRKELIGIANRCFRCLAAGLHRRECPNVKQCGVDGYLRGSLCKILISSFAHKTDFANNLSVDFF